MNVLQMYAVLQARIAARMARLDKQQLRELIANGRPATAWHARHELRRRQREAE